MLETQISRIAERLQSKDNIKTEEATKNAFVLPFIQALGYDIFNPLEVIPEFIADIGRKKGEKVDYCIQKEGVPVIIMECKHWADNLKSHSTQLQRYFHVTKARFSVLTNGVTYQFFTDLDAPNIMDKKPFLVFSIDKLDNKVMLEIAKFQKSSFDVDNILSSASELKYVGGIKDIFLKELKEPSSDFVKFFAKQVYSGILTSKVTAQFSELVKTSLNSVLNERVTNRLNIAQQKEVEDQSLEDEPKITTTNEELEAFYIIKAILGQAIDPSRVHHRDTQSYFGILLDDNNRKPICRLFLEKSNWYIGLFDNGKDMDKQPIQSTNDIYKFSERIIKAAKNYDGDN